MGQYFLLTIVTGAVESVSITHTHTHIYKSIEQKIDFLTFSNKNFDICKSSG